MPRFSLSKRKPQDKEQPAAEKQVPEEQGAKPQEPDALSPQVVEDVPPGDPEPPANMEGSQEDSMEPEEAGPEENAEQENQEEPQGESQESSDSLLAIFQQEEVKDLEIDSLVAGLEDVDVQDLLKESRELARRLRGESPDNGG